MTDSTPMFDRHHERLIHNMSFTIMRDTRNNQWVTEAWCLVDGGLRHQVMRWHTRPRVTEIRTECSGTGFFSKRPYTLGQACDGSISAPVIALYADFCKARGLDAVALLQRAYPDEDAWELKPSHEHALMPIGRAPTFPPCGTPRPCKACSHR